MNTCRKSTKKSIINVDERCFNFSIDDFEKEFYHREELRVIISILLIRVLSQNVSTYLSVVILFLQDVSVYDVTFPSITVLVAKTCFFCLLSL